MRGKQFGPDKTGCAAMSESKPDSSPVVMAMPAEPRNPGGRSGCIVAGCLVGIVGIFLTFMIGVVCLASFAIFEINENEEGFSFFPLGDIQSNSNSGGGQALRDEAAQDIQIGRMAMLQPTNPQEHPEYDRVVEFVDRLQAVLDDNVNPEILEYIDYDRHLDEMIRRSEKLRNDHVDYTLYRGVWKDTLKQQIIGPASFANYEITRIENEGSNKLRVHVSYALSGYRTSEPHIWWLADDEEFKIYDWSQLELGLRDSSENAILIDASASEAVGYGEYVGLCYEYLATGTQQLSAFEREQEVKRILEECEQFTGPAALRPSVFMITATRWYHEGQNKRALALLDKIVDRESVPGAYRLAGDILFEQGEFELAGKAYRDFIALLGPTSHAQSQLATCYRNTGDTSAERELLMLTVASREQNFPAIAQLIELNNDNENRTLFSQIDKSPSCDAAYVYLARRFGDADFFADRFELIRAHLQETHPRSQAAVLAGMYADSSVKNAVAMLKWIDENIEEDPEELRYGFWYDLDESQMVEVLSSSQTSTKNFDTICEVSDYEASISDEVMLAVSQWVLKSQPDNFVAHYQNGFAQSSLGKFALAADSLRNSLASMPPSHDDREMVRLGLMNALYQSGDRSGVLDLATDVSSVTQLLGIKTRRADFSDFENLLVRLDADSADFKFYKALFQHHEGDTDAAVRVVAELLKQADETEARDYRAYLYQDKLVEFCQLQDDPTKAFRLVPTESMFALVSRRLIQDFDWPNCERLLQTQGGANDELRRVQFRQQIDFEQGNYEQVVAQATDVLRLASTENLSVELERLVRAALRIGKPDQAMQFAGSAAMLAARQDLVALVALSQQNVEQAGRQFSQLRQSQKEQFYTDLDLLHLDWRKVVPSNQLPQRHPAYGASLPRRFDLRMLFRDRQPYRQEQLQADLATVLGEDVHVERVVLPDGSPDMWVVESKQGRIFISQDPIDGTKASKYCDSKKLKPAIAESSSQIRLVGLAAGPTTAQADHEIAVSVIQCLVNEGLCAVGNGSRWVAAADAVRCLKQSAEPQTPASSRLFGVGEFSGDLFYLIEEDDSQVEFRKTEFFNELVSSLKRFDDSADPGKMLSVQFGMRRNIPERINAKVDRLRRTGYGVVMLEVTIVDDARFDLTVRKGDKAVLSPYEVDRFELRTSDQVLQRERPYDGTAQ